MKRKKNESSTTEVEDLLNDSKIHGNSLFTDLNYIIEAEEQWKTLKSQWKDRHANGTLYEFIDEVIEEEFLIEEEKKKTNLILKGYLVFFLATRLAKLHQTNRKDSLLIANCRITMMMFKYPSIYPNPSLAYLDRLTFYYKVGSFTRDLYKEWYRFRRFQLRRVPFSSNEKTMNVFIKFYDLGVWPMSLMDIVVEKRISFRSSVSSRTIDNLYKQMKKSIEENARTPYVLSYSLPLLDRDEFFVPPENKTGFLFGETPLLFGRLPICEEKDVSPLKKRYKQFIS